MTDQPMTDERLAEIKAAFGQSSHGREIRELVNEVRRLQDRVQELLRASDAQRSEFGEARVRLSQALRTERERADRSEAGERAADAEVERLRETNDLLRAELRRARRDPRAWYERR